MPMHNQNAGESKINGNDRFIKNAETVKAPAIMLFRRKPIGFCLYMSRTANPNTAIMERNAKAT